MAESVDLRDQLNVRWRTFGALNTLDQPTYGPFIADIDTEPITVWSKQSRLRKGRTFNTLVNQPKSLLAFSLSTFGDHL